MDLINTLKSRGLYLAPSTVIRIARFLHKEGFIQKIDTNTYIPNSYYYGQRTDTKTCEQSA